MKVCLSVLGFWHGEHWMEGTRWGSPYSTLTMYKQLGFDCVIYSTCLVGYSIYCMWADLCCVSCAASAMLEFSLLAVYICRYLMGQPGCIEQYGGLDNKNVLPSPYNIMNFSGSGQKFCCFSTVNIV